MSSDYVPYPYKSSNPKKSIQTINVWIRKYTVDNVWDFVFFPDNFYSFSMKNKILISTTAA